MCSGIVESKVGSRQRPKKKPMGDKRGWPDRKSSWLGKKPRTVPRLLATVKPGFQKIAGAFKREEGPEQERSLVNSKNKSL